MNYDLEKNHCYESFLEELEESIIIFQKKVKQKVNDKRFNARAFLAKELGYKDEKILYRFLDVNDVSRAKMGLLDIEKIMMITGDAGPLENYLNELKEKINKNNRGINENL